MDLSITATGTAHPIPLSLPTGTGQCQKLHGSRGIQDFKMNLSNAENWRNHWDAGILDRKTIQTAAVQINHL